MLMLYITPKVWDPNILLKYKHQKHSALYLKNTVNWLLNSHDKNSACWKLLQVKKKELIFTISQFEVIVILDHLLQWALPEGQRWDAVV